MTDNTSGCCEVILFLYGIKKKTETRSVLKMKSFASPGNLPEAGWPRLSLIIIMEICKAPTLRLKSLNKLSIIDAPVDYLLSVVFSPFFPCSTSLQTISMIHLNLSVRFRGNVWVPKSRQLPFFCCCFLFVCFLIYSFSLLLIVVLVVVMSVSECVCVCVC